MYFVVVIECGDDFSWGDSVFFLSFDEVDF